MLRKVLVLALLVLPLLAGCNQEAKTGGVAVVDLARVQQESKVVKSIQEHLTKMNNELMTKALAADKARKETPSEENDKAFNETMTQLQQSMQAEQQRLGNYLGKELKRIMEEYRAEKKLDVLLLKEAVAAMDPSKDATDDILKRLDELKPELDAPAPADDQKAMESAPADEQAPAVEEAPAQGEQPAAPADEAPAAEGKPAE